MRLPVLGVVAITAVWLVLAAGSADALPRGAVREPAPSLFGINTGTYDSSHARYVRDLPAARRLGARWVHFTGDSVHWRGSHVQFGVLDYEITRARQLGMGVLVSLGGAATACSLRPRPAIVAQCPPTTPADLRAYARFVRTEVLRYRHVVDTYESWVEPNQTTSWRPYPNPDQYAALLRTEYAVFQAVNRRYGLHLKLLFAGPNGFSIVPPSPNGIPALAFVHAVLGDLDGARAFDAIAVHGYRYPERNSGPLGIDWGPAQPEWDYVAGTAASTDGQVWRQLSWPQELSAYEQEFAADGYPGMGLWVTEFGWPGVADPGRAPAGERNLYPSFQTQAGWLRQAYDDLLALPFVRSAFVFDLRDYQPRLANPDPAFFAHYGLLRYDFAPKPAARVFERLAHARPRR